MNEPAIKAGAPDLPAPEVTRTAAAPVGLEKP
jgi:hypothetical protein